MPGAEDVAGKIPGEVQPVKGSRIGPVMRRRTPDEDLGEKEEDRHGEEFHGRPLAARRPSRQELRMDVLSRSLPPEKIELAENKQDGRGSGKEHHEAEGAPEIGAGCRPIAHCRIVGKIGCIGVIFPRAVGCRRPGRPGKEGGQLPDLFRLVDKSPQKSPIDGGVVEVGGPFPESVSGTRPFVLREEERCP